MSETATEQQARIDRLEQKIDRVAELLEQGGRRNEERAEDILARLPAEDRALLERERFRRQYGADVRTMIGEYLDELDKEDDKPADNDEPDDDDDADDADDDADDDASAAKPKPKPKPAAKPKPRKRPPGRHPAADELPGEGDEKPEPWWRRD